MPPPQLSPQWQPLPKTKARMRTLQFNNTVTLVFLQFHESQRIASYVSAKLEIDAVGGAQGDGDVAVQVHFGNRDDLWAQVIARRLIELVGTDVLVALSSKSPQNEQDTRLLLEELKLLLLH